VKNFTLSNNFVSLFGLPENVRFRDLNLKVKVKVKNENFSKPRSDSDSSRRSCLNCKKILEKEEKRLWNCNNLLF
jgi:hypothetical protein